MPKKQDDNILQAIQDSFNSPQSELSRERLENRTTQIHKEPAIRRVPRYPRLDELDGDENG